MFCIFQYVLMFQEVDFVEKDKFYSDFCIFLQGILLDDKVLFFGDLNVRQVEILKFGKVFLVDIVLEIVMIMGVYYLRFVLNINLLLLILFFSREIV